VLVAKYLDHLPLCRQEAIFVRAGHMIPDFSRDDLERTKHNGPIWGRFFIQLFASALPALLDASAELLEASGNVQRIQPAG